MKHATNLYQKKLARSRQDLSNFLIALGLSFGIVMMILQLQLGIGVERRQISIVRIEAGSANNYLNNLISSNRYFKTQDEYQNFLDSLASNFSLGGSDTIYADVAVNLENREYRYLQIIRGEKVPARLLNLIYHSDDKEGAGFRFAVERENNIQPSRQDDPQFENMEQTWDFYKQNVLDR